MLATTENLKEGEESPVTPPFLRHQSQHFGAALSYCALGHKIGIKLYLQSMVFLNFILYPPKKRYVFIINYFL